MESVTKRSPARRASPMQELRESVRRKDVLLVRARDELALRHAGTHTGCRLCELLNAMEQEIAGG